MGKKGSEIKHSGMNRRKWKLLQRMYTNENGMIHMISLPKYTAPQQINKKNIRKQNVVLECKIGKILQYEHVQLKNL
jgi:hypothetical protein